MAAAARSGTVVVSLPTKWRWVIKTDRGFDVAFHGEYRELVPNERIVHTEVFEGAPGAGALTTLTFTEANGQTTVTILVEHANEPDRDMHIGSGMEAGMQDAMDLLEEMAISLM